MALSYSARLLCVILCSIGLVSIASEITLRAMAPFLLRLLAGSSARKQELVLYAVQIIPVVLALSSTAMSLVPAYVIHETNLATERVGWFCLALALTITFRFGIPLARGIYLVLETMRFTQTCKRSTEHVLTTHHTEQIIAMRGMPDGLALVGLLRPVILISPSLLEQGGLTPLALEIALDHEWSHARHNDNWKLFSLRALPSLSLRLPDGKTWIQHWRAAAECAADDDAVRGEISRALLLAETLVALGRNASAASLPVLSTTLLSAETDFVARVERLLQPVQEVSLQDQKKMLLLCSILLCGAFAFVLLCCAVAGLPEHLLHLG